VLAAVERTIQAFGRIDVLVNNASAIALTPTPETEMKRFDLMHQINVRGTFLCSRACLPYLERAENPHILVLAPPLTLKPEYFAPHLGYSLSKFGMSLCVLGLAEELKAKRIGVNALWPRSIIATAAIEHVVGGAPLLARSRKPEIVADAAYTILTRSSRDFTGNFCIDEDVLRETGVTDFSPYAVTPGAELWPDLFIG
jgi:citronellol/citronellal dehydrogenase